MIRISDIKLPLSYNDAVIRKIVARTLRVDGKAITNIRMFRRSVDARHKNDVHFNCTVETELSLNERDVLKNCKNAKATIAQPYEYQMPAAKKLPQKPVIVGAGPAGLFAALILAQCGAKPIVIERGKDVEKRQKDVASFWNGGELLGDSNVQFGEGGAGAFSDGKLNTGTKDLRGRKVLIELVKAGAPKEILYNAKPHVGTDRLPGAVRRIREAIISLGGVFHFETKLTDIKTKDGRIVGLSVKKNDKEEMIETDKIILAIGHSARDTFELLKEKSVYMEPKSFSIGVRIEHLRSMIDQSQYGESAGKGMLGAADYKLASHLSNGRSVYTFCMCPGGSVVAAASECGMVVTNGMSEFARDQNNSNSALLVGVTPADFGSGDVLAGVEYQRRLEKAAFLAGGENYGAPVQRTDDFISKRKTNGFGSVLPTYLPGVNPYNLHDILPEYITDSLSQGILQMNNKLRGFSDGDAVLTGVETRSSSPVRILRSENLESVTVRGLYPCGEGAGYAGGIISAAVDGIKCAEALLK